MRRKKSLPSFIDNERYFLRWEKHRDGSVVFYKRLSDGESSQGVIKWFEIAKDERIVVTLIDNLLNNYQSCYYEDIIEAPEKKLVEKIKKKS